VGTPTSAGGWWMFHF